MILVLVLFPLLTMALFAAFEMIFFWYIILRANSWRVTASSGILVSIVAYFFYYSEFVRTTAIFLVTVLIALINTLTISGAHVVSLPFGWPDSPSEEQKVFALTIVCGLLFMAVRKWHNWLFSQRL